MNQSFSNIRSAFLISALIACFLPFLCWSQDPINSTDILNSLAKSEFEEQSPKYSMERLLKESELVVIGMLVETKVSTDKSIPSDLLRFSKALVAYESSFKVLGIVSTHTKNQSIEPTAQITLRHFYWDSKVIRSKTPALFSGMIEKTIEVDLESGKILEEKDKGTIMMLFLKRHGAAMQFEPVTGQRWPTLSMRSL